MEWQGEAGQLWEQSLQEYGRLIGWQYAVFSDHEKRTVMLQSAHFQFDASGALSEKEVRLTDDVGQTWTVVTQLPSEKQAEHEVYLSLLSDRISALASERRRMRQLFERTAPPPLSKEGFLKQVLTAVNREIEDLRKKLHIKDLDAARVCLFACRDMAEQVKKLLGHLVPALKDQLVMIDDHHVVLLATEEEEAVFTADCRMMVEMIEAELMQPTVLTVSERYPFERLRLGYLEALTALRLGRLYYADRRIIGFRDVAVARLLELLPAQEARQFSLEILPESVWKQLHEEDISTIYMMFANNLNISETARKLYIHRNTMVYRLDRIHKIIGLDIRIFEEAILLRMVLSLQKMI